MWTTDKTYSITSGQNLETNESNEPKYAVIRQWRPTLNNISNDRLIRFNRFGWQFPVHPCKGMYNHIQLAVYMMMSQHIKTAK